MEFRVFGDASLTVTDNNITETKLWPNPTTNSIKISNYKEFQNLSVYNSVGQLVLQQNINNESIDISKLNSGIYIFKLSGSNTTINKFIIKN
ncbi:T9SS type A sorting domain-containing protein [Seonamhaeicola sp. MEBiC1930]